MATDDGGSGRLPLVIVTLVAFLSGWMAAPDPKPPAFEQFGPSIVLTQIDEPVPGGVFVLHSGPTPWPAVEDALATVIAVLESEPKGDAYQTDVLLSMAVDRANALAQVPDFECSPPVERLVDTLNDLLPETHYWDASRRSVEQQRQSETIKDAIGILIAKLCG